MLLGTNRSRQPELVITSLLGRSENLVAGSLAAVSRNARALCGASLELRQ